MRINRKLDAIYALLQSVASKINVQADYVLPAEFVEQMPDRITLAGGAEPPPLPLPYKWVDVSRNAANGSPKTYEWVKSR